MSISVNMYNFLMENKKVEIEMDEHQEKVIRDNPFEEVLKEKCRNSIENLSEVLKKKRELNMCIEGRIQAEKDLIAREVVVRMNMLV